MLLCIIFVLLKKNMYIYNNKYSKQKVLMTTLGLGLIVLVDIQLYVNLTQDQILLLLFL